MVRFQADANTPRILVFIMFFFSTILYIWLIFIVLTKSPAAMKRYKYMIVVLSFSVYQFDVIHTLLNPTGLPRMAGVHFSGILGYNYPELGNTLFLVYCISLMINGLSLTVSFVWREFAIIKFKFTFLSILFHLIHLLIVVASFVGFFFVFHKTLPDVSVVKAELDKMSSYYHPHFALFGWLNYDDFYFFFEYVLFLYLVGCTIGIKSIIRISIVMYRRENKYGNSRRLNENALRVHKMLFRALLFETMAPIIVFVIPMTILIMIHLCLGRLFNYFGGVEEGKLGKMIPFEFEANPSRILVFVLFFLSTILYIWLLYIILYKSPPCMARYKYVIMFLSFSVYQFDVIQTLLCPTAIHRMAGAQFSGILGYLFPESGNTLFLIYCTSIMLNGIALAFNFVWREFAINTFKPNCLSIFLHFLHYLAVVCCLAGFYVVSYKTVGTAEQWEMRRHLNSCGSFYNPNYALFGWIPAKIDDFYTFFKYVLFCYLFAHTIVLKSVIRISIAIYRRNNNYVASRRLNESTLRVHKMLFRALLFEALTPLIPFVIPITMIIVVHLFCEYWEAHSGGYAQAEAFVLNLVAMALMLPSFFSIIHVFTVIWFTTPYKNYVKQKTTSALKLITGK